LTKLEASLQALYTGTDLLVVMMSETTRLAKHGLVLFSKSKKKLQDLKTAVRRSANSNLSAVQQSTLSKQKTKLLTQDSLQSTMQAGSICSKFTNSSHLDELAAVVLQALCCAIHSPASIGSFELCHL